MRPHRHHRTPRGEFQVCYKLFGMCSIKIFNNRDVIEAAQLTMDAYDAIILTEPYTCDSFAMKCDTNILVVVTASLLAYLFASFSN